MRRGGGSLLQPPVVAKWTVETLGVPVGEPDLLWLEIWASPNFGEPCVTAAAAEGR